jgi:hypothetical protein
MNMGDSIIEMKGSLKQIQLENMMIQKIRSELCDSFANVQDIKMNVDLIRQICCTIEDMTSGKKIDKFRVSSDGRIRRGAHARSLCWGWCPGFRGPTTHEGAEKGRRGDTEGRL